MENFVDERDYALLENEKYTFFVLRRIIGGKCEVLLTDHEKAIICYSCRPYPVWVWTAEKLTDEEKSKVYEAVKAEGLLDGNHTFNLKYFMADYFIKRAAKEGISLTIKENMLSYSCPEIIEPHIIADGKLRKCDRQDFGELEELIRLFHEETGINIGDETLYSQRAQDMLDTGHPFFWCDSEGKIVAVCNIRPSGNLASLGMVYTRKEHRRKHYAENLVFAVSKMIKEAGYIPTLYTDADYAASNSCYKKIGYKIEGQLCTVGSANNQPFALL